MKWSGWVLAAGLAAGQAFAQSATQTTNEATAEPRTAQVAQVPASECSALCAGQEVELELADRRLRAP